MIEEAENVMIPFLKDQFQSGLEHGVFVVNGVGEQKMKVLGGSHRYPSLSRYNKLAAIRLADVHFYQLDHNSIELYAQIPTEDEGYVHWTTWSDDGKYLAINHRDIIKVYEGELQKLALDMRSLQSSIAWMPNSHSLVFRTSTFVMNPNADDSEQVFVQKLLRLDVETGDVTEVCQANFEKFFRYYERPASLPEVPKPTCLDTPEGRALFGSPEHPTRRLITRSPSGRLYFYHVFLDGVFIRRGWIEGYDTVTKRRWKVVTTQSFWDNFK
jgi:hypothetical protein